MAKKIDTSLIEGYADMTAEQKIAALEALEIEVEKDTTDIDKLKAALSRANSEAAENKRKLREKLSAEEQAEADRAARDAEREARIAELEKAAALSNYKAKYISLGYDEKLATETAEAFANGDMAKVFDAQQRHIEVVKKAERAAALAGAGSPPPAGTGGATVTKEQFDAMGYRERAELYSTNKELYNELNGGTE